MDLTLIIAIATMGGLGFLFAGGLAIADKKLRVEENPLIGKINDLLPGANCGACGVFCAANRSCVQGECACRGDLTVAHTSPEACSLVMGKARRASDRGTGFTGGPV